MEASQKIGSMSPEAPRLWSGVGLLLGLAWLYILGWAAFMITAAFQSDAGGWELGEWLMMGALFVPLLLIPFYLVHCAGRKQAPRFRPWLPWAFRIMCLSLVLAILDSWVAGTDRRAPLFSKVLWATKDGGTRGSVGLGYMLTYHRAMGGEHGPEVWFWFTPFTVCLTTEHTGLRWIWQH
jgi:hypothetical protein